MLAITPGWRPRKCFSFQVNIIAKKQQQLYDLFYIKSPHLINKAVPYWLINKFPV